MKFQVINHQISTSVGGSSFGPTTYVWAPNTSSSRKHSRPRRGHGTSPNWVNLNGKNIYELGIKHGNHRCFSYDFLCFSIIFRTGNHHVSKNLWISCDFLADVSRLRANPHLMFDVGSISSPIQRPVSPCHFRGSIVMEVPLYRWMVFVVENSMKVDDLGGPPFQETSTYSLKIP